MIGVALLLRFLLINAFAIFGSPMSSTAHSLRPLLLGSKSATRLAILREMGYNPIVRSADIDEKAIGDRAGGDTADLVLQIANAKADALLPLLLQDPQQRAGADVLLTADQVVLHTNRVLEKPADLDEVRSNIASYARSPCQTIGSAVLCDLTSGKRFQGVDTATIYFSEMPEAVVDEVCESHDILWCAGGLMIEHPAVQPYIVRIDGTLDSVMGLSKSLVSKLMQQMEEARANS